MLRTRRLLFYSVASLAVCSLPAVRGAEAQEKTGDLYQNTATDTAQTPLPAHAPIALPRVRVRGTETATVPQASSSLSRAELQRVQPNEPYAILTGLPGVYFQNDGTPSLAVSMRGMQDFGRVNVMIDGARQNFQESGHGADGSVYVDPALLAGLDVRRGTVATGDGAGAIAGVMNLHTFDVDDLVDPGKRYGVLGRALGGTNNYDGSGVVGAGARINDWLGVAAAFSMRSSGDYEDGNGARVAHTFQRLQSGLFKIDITPGVDQTLKLGTVIYHNAFGVGSEGIATADSVQNNTGTIDYRFTPRDNKLVALHVKGYVVRTSMANYTPSFMGVSVAAADLTHYGLTTLGFEADNTTTLRGGPIDIALNYGGEYYHDSVSTTDQTGYTGATPSGGRSVGSAFTQATLGWKIVQLTGALRYDSYNLSGGGVNEAGGFTTAAAGRFHVSKGSDAVNPKVTLALNPVQGLQIYGNYGLGFRPPATTETLYSGSHPGLGFLKFIPNPALDPERTYGWEVGMKLHYSDILADHDHLEFSADYFDTRIKDYIGQTLVVGAPAAGSYIPTYGYFFQNISGNTRTSGVEGQAKYDSRFVFATLSYTNTTTKLPGEDYTGYDQMVTTPPRSVMAGTLGFHLLDNRLTLGGRIRAATHTLGQTSSDSGVSPLRAGYVVFDLFGSYQITRSLQLFTSADNVTNRQYYTSALASIPNQGLTVMSGLNFALSR
ncbi:TonB-dependent receptor domain-containing protein [Gluconobacter kanchanaburiensis]|uniref:Hemin receptor n=2 Tax=Gluconobacter kanchanaburiensis TaxID=563199 RepID=A0A511BCB1_9PROT|nr:TonB-dependent receptor [Gluconobacter kanchanaburiensis]MBF0862248.1 TonB-dependent receptor [Gluconobacter kanchanaburiensis]GEK97422.1 hemin receptor [Gluconobacter kanchanaburiensis NBRC 103587]